MTESKHDRYNRSAKGRARVRRYEATPKAKARRDRHEATRGYLRKRVRALEAERARVLEELRSVQKEILDVRRVAEGTSETGRS